MDGNTFLKVFCQKISGLFSAILGKAPGQNWKTMIDLASKLGETNNIEHNKGSKTYPQNQIVIFQACH